MVFDYSDALRLMKGGAHMRRLAWKPDKYVWCRESDGVSLTHLVITTAEGTAPYTPSRCDQFEVDWVHFIGERS